MRSCTAPGAPPATDAPRVKPTRARADHARVGKTKGTVVLKAVKVLRGRKDEAKKQLPAALHHYLQDRIVVSSWYPEDEFFALLCACAALFPMGDSAFEMLGAETARDHAQNMYADIVKRDFASRAKIMWKTQHDSGEFVLTTESDFSATYELHDWDYASPKYCRVVGGYFTELHRLSGAQSPVYTHPVCKSTKGDRCVFVVSWLG